jgi:hypothetical protein
MAPGRGEEEPTMSEIRMTGEIRTDYECEATGLPAERWAEAVFKLGNEELVLEVSVEKDVIVAIMAGEDRRLEGHARGPQENPARRDHGQVARSAWSSATSPP